MRTRRTEPPSVRIVDGAAFIALTQGYEAVIDAADVPLVDGRVWRVSVSPGGVYAITTVRTDAGRRKALLLHTLITGFALVDHRDGNGLNCRRENMRPATRAQNNRNSRMQKNNRAGFKGVSPTPSGKWRARIAVDGKQKTLGTFDQPETAHRAYCEASAALHGEFGRTA